MHLVFTAEISIFAADFVDNIVSEAIHKLCYKIADDLIQIILEKAHTIIQGKISSFPNL